MNENEPMHISDEDAAPADRIERPGGDAEKMENMETTRRLYTIFVCRRSVYTHFGSFFLDSSFPLKMCPIPYATL